MPSVILQTGIRYLAPLLLMFSVFLLLRGHQEPGGGFVGGLVAAAAFALYSIAFNIQETRRVLRIDPRYFTAFGLSLAAGSGLFSLTQGEAFMTGIWDEATYPAIGHLGTPAIFDTGVYFVVLGVMLTIILNLAEEA